MAVAFIPFAFPGVAPGPREIRCFFQIRTPHDAEASPPGESPENVWSGGNISFDVGDDPLRVAANRKDLLARLSANGAREICELRQVHGDRLVFDPAPAPFVEPSVLPEADGMATDRPGRALLIKTADCQPVLLAHARGACIAALHVGWRGNRIGFLGRAVSELCRNYGVRAEDFYAVRGPSLGPAAAEFVNYNAEWGPEFDAWHDPAAHVMNLWRLTRDQLVAAGLREERIFGLDLCTHTLAEAFFSYRRRRVCGRQTGIIMIAEAANATGAAAC